jgi:membrane fusion protein (multidrug efflux system)
VVETAERKDVPLLLELVAHTESVATVELRATVEGLLTSATPDDGRMVQKGQLLFQIDPRRYDAAAQSARAAVEKAEADLEMAREQERSVSAQSALRQAEAGLLKANQDAERLKPLAERRAVPQRDLEAAIAAQSSASAAVADARATVRTTAVGDRMGLRQAQAGLSAARAVLETAELDREAASIRAPIAGLIGKVEVAAGNYVGRGESSRLASIFQIDPIHVVFSIPEALYLRTRTQNVDRQALDQIELILSDNTVYPARGRFSSLGAVVDSKTGTVMVEAEFPNPRGVLLPGMFGRVRVASETRKGAVLVPERALFEAQGSMAVYIVDGGKVALRSVVSEGSHEGKSIVSRGLAGGENVIVEGIMKVRPGQPVAVQKPRGGPAR